MNLILELYISHLQSSCLQLTSDTCFLDYMELEPHFTTKKFKSLNLYSLMYRSTLYFVDANINKNYIFLGLKYVVFTDPPRLNFTFSVGRNKILDSLSTILTSSHPIFCRLLRSEYTRLSTIFTSPHPIFYRLLRSEQPVCHQVE